MIKLKTVEEINRIRESCWLLVETYDELEKVIGPGITTLELDKFAKNYILKKGGRPAYLNYMGYPATLCTSVNSVVIHGIPSKQELKNGDILSLDLGINLKGYFSDAARTYIIGTVSQEIEKLIIETKTCLDLGISAAVSGNRIKDISKAVYNHASRHNYGVVKEFCGHGVGFSQHEEPQVPNYVSKGPNPRLKEGMVLAIEPMITMGSGDIVILDDKWTVQTKDKSPAAHWEHTIAIFKDHTEILTIKQ